MVRKYSQVSSFVSQAFDVHPNGDRETIFRAAKELSGGKLSNAQIMGPYYRLRKQRAGVTVTVEHRSHVSAAELIDRAIADLEDRLSGSRQRVSVEQKELVAYKAARKILKS